MVDIKLKDGQTGYEVVNCYIKRYCEHNIYSDIIISIGTSYDGQTYHLSKIVAIPDFATDCVGYIHRWWGGEKYIKLFGIKTINDLDIFGGIYED